MAPKVRGLIIGGGSIGLRHYQNFKTLLVNDLSIVETDPTRTAHLESELKRDAGNRIFPNLDSALSTKPDFAVIASPSYLHVEQALQLAREGIHLFIEKPLSHNKERVNTLIAEIEKRKLVSLVGCNMRFHPGPATVKKLLTQNEIGRILFAEVSTGSYLPRWRPQSNYRKSYSAKEKMGGGCLLDCIHEIDLTRWYLGEVSEVFCRSANIGQLEIETEDYAFLSCQHKSGSLSEIHLDYLQQPYYRGCRIIGTEGTVEWDMRNTYCRVFTLPTGVWKEITVCEKWDLNQMYLDEASHFLKCVESNSPTCCPVSEGAKVLQIALSAKLSAHEGRSIAVD